MKREKQGLRCSRGCESQHLSRIFTESSSVGRGQCKDNRHDLSPRHAGAEQIFEGIPRFPIRFESVPSSLSFSLSFCPPPLPPRDMIDEWKTAVLEKGNWLQLSLRTRFSIVMMRVERIFLLALPPWFEKLALGNESPSMEIVLFRAEIAVLNFAFVNLAWRIRKKFNLAANR